MSLYIKHSLCCICSDEKFQEIVAFIGKEPTHHSDMFDYYIATESNRWDLYDFYYNAETKSICFGTKNEDPGVKIARYLTGKVCDAEIQVSSDGGYFGSYYCRAACINGHELFVEQYGVCDYRIRVPKDLGYDQIFETFAFIPERICLDRDDLNQIAKHVLIEAIKQSEKRYEAEQLLKNPALFARALVEAQASIVKYSQFSSERKEEISGYDQLCECEPKDPLNFSSDDELPF